MKLENLDRMINRITLLLFIGLVFGQPELEWMQTYESENSESSWAMEILDDGLSFGALMHMLLELILWAMNYGVNHTVIV